MRDGIDEFGETAPDQDDLIAIEEAREAWALTRSHGASDDPLSPPTPQNWGIYGVLRRVWDVAAGIWGSNPALICPYDDSGPSVRLVGCLNARVGCCYHEMLISVRFLKTAILSSLIIPGGGGCVKSVLYRTLSVRDLYFIFAYIGLNPYYIRAYIGLYHRVHRAYIGLF